MRRPGAASLLAAVLLLLGGAESTAEPRQPVVRTVPRTHVVASGDTLGAIATRYKVTVAALVAANRLTNEKVTLKLGQRLVIPAAAPTQAGPTQAAPTQAAPRQAAPTQTAPTQAAPSAPAVGATPRSPARVVTPARATAATPTRLPPPVRGPKGLELAVPDFVDVSPLFAWPVEGPVTSTFGRRRTGWHRGIDIKADKGAVVFAAAAGVVAVSAVEPRYGRVVKIEHDDGYVTVYAHNEENLVQAGMRVAAGDPIATIGRTGRATAHHLHFEIRHNGSVYNPLYLLPMPPRVGQVEESEDSEGEEHE
jgi:murein DD-endopeptidase MepM/ murein hydrolase activator NlpD